MSIRNIWTFTWVIKLVLVVLQLKKQTPPAKQYHRRSSNCQHNVIRFSTD